MNDDARTIPVVVHPDLGLRRYETADGEVFDRDAATPVSPERFAELSSLRWQGSQLLVRGKPASRGLASRRPGNSGGVVVTDPGEYGVDIGGLYVDPEISYAGVDGGGFWIDEELAGGKVGVDEGGLWFDG
jgi:hypothetical protein